MSKKQPKIRTFRRWPSDDFVLDSIGEQYGIDSTAVFRIAIRDFAYKHGFAHPEMHEMLLVMRNLITGCRLAKVQGMEKTLAKGEKILKRHMDRLEKAYRFDEYPKEIEQEVLREERKLRTKTKR